MRDEPENSREARANPLASGDAREWQRLVDAVGPASLLLVIESRMGAVLLGRLSAEDIWQDTLLHAWRDRARCVWTGVHGFRRWLLGIIDHRIHDARDFFNAAKRDGHRERTFVRPAADTWHEEPACTTTPSRLAQHREQAEQMKRALATVPEELRDVVRLRLFESKSTEEIAHELAIGTSATKHRYRKGVETYRRALLRQVDTRAREAR